MKRIAILSALMLIGFCALAQKKEYKSVVIGFYNLENLFDTVDNPKINDEEFLPSGAKNYNGTIYFDKLKKLSTVISQMGTEANPDGAALLGVAEIENDTVLNDLVKQPLIANRKYKIINYESPDIRGVEVGLLYNPKYFKVVNSRNLYVQLPGGAKDAYYTRDILWVQGLLDGETVHIYVNHWPSRSGGEKRSAPGRVASATVCKNHMDSIAKLEPNVKFIVMGDLNDNPVNESIAKVIGAKGKQKDVAIGGIYNPWTELYKKGIGTLAYQDAWGLFDQILISQPFLNKEQNGLFFYQQHIFQKEYLIENRGRYKGYPMRTWDGNSYRGGYSDHLATYLIMLKLKQQQSKGF